MITNDRYTKAFLFFAAGVAVSIYFIRTGKGYLSAVPIIVTGLPALWLLGRPAKLHITNDQKNSLNAQYKGESDCRFSPEYKSDIDGIKIAGTRYKFVDGTDVCINELNEVKPCGPGSAIMQFIGGGGKEPKSIQQDVCWQ